MNSHPYVRAYMAGIVVPSLFMLAIFCAFVVPHFFVFKETVPIERFLIFPMALAPNLFGVWNMLYLRLRQHGYIPIGLHGAFLPFLIAPSGFFVGTSLGFVTAGHGRITWFQAISLPYALVATGFAIALVIYYLVWKYFVNFFNELLGVA